MRSKPDYKKIQNPVPIPVPAEESSEPDSIDWKSFLGCDDDASEDEIDKMFESQF